MAALGGASGGASGVWRPGIRRLGPGPGPGAGPGRRRRLGIKKPERVKLGCVVRWRLLEKFFVGVQSLQN